MVRDRNPNWYENLMMWPAKRSAKKTGKVSMRLMMINIYDLTFQDVAASRREYDEAIVSNSHGTLTPLHRNNSQSTWKITLTFFTRRLDFWDFLERNSNFTPSQLKGWKLDKKLLGKNKTENVFCVILFRVIASNELLIHVSPNTSIIVISKELWDVCRWCRRCFSRDVETCKSFPRRHHRQSARLEPVSPFFPPDLFNEKWLRSLLNYASSSQIAIINKSFENAWRGSEKKFSRRKIGLSSTDFCSRDSYFHKICNLCPFQIQFGAVNWPSLDTLNTFSVTTFMYDKK